jgi:hypothetical protein
LASIFFSGGKQFVDRKKECHNWLISPCRGATDKIKLSKMAERKLHERNCRMQQLQNRNASGSLIFSTSILRAKFKH